MSYQSNSNCESLFEYFENKLFIPNIYDNALNFFFKLEFSFLSGNSDYIDLITFQSYLDIPFLFSERLFYVFSNNKKLLIKDSYLKYIYIIFFGTQEEKIKLLFNFLSFKNELINKNDIKIFLNNLILDLSSNFDDYEKDIQIYIDYIFSFSNKKDNLNYEEFKNILSNYDSGLFYIFYLYFFNYKKFNNEILSFLNNYLIKQNKKNTSITFSKTNLDFSTTITNSEIHIEIDKNSTIKKIPQRKTSTFKVTRKEINIIKKIQINLLSILKNIFLIKNNLIKDLDNQLKNDNEENEYSDDDSLDELNNFEKEVIQVKTNTFSEDIENFLITESVFSPITNNSKNSNKLKSQMTISSYNSKINNNDLNESDFILVQFKPSNLINQFYYILFTNFLILFTDKKIYLIPYKRLYSNYLIDVKINDNDYLCLDFISCINDFSFSLFFENQFKLSYFQNIFLPKNKIPYLNDLYTLYEKEIIGKGTFSKVYLCKKYSNNQIYCIKEIDKHIKCDNPYLNKKFINKEIDICEHLLKKIKYNSIIQCEDIFETKDKVYIIFTYYNQGNLNDFFQKYYSFSLHCMNNDRIKIIDNILNQLISTLKYIEKFGITHRDIKPENILVTYNSNLDLKIHLIDFGFADVGLYNQEMNSCIGTLVFTAPEIIMTNCYFRNVDTWSLGILAFYLLFDNFPFDITHEDNDLDCVKRKILENDFSFPYNRIDKNKYDNKIRNLILFCLIKEQNKRPRISKIDYI